MGEDCSSVGTEGKNVRVDLEEPGIHVSEEHIFALTVSLAIK
jgi:hypothetical protein